MFGCSLSNSMALNRQVQTIKLSNNLESNKISEQGEVPIDNFHFILRFHTEYITIIYFWRNKIYILLKSEEKKIYPANLNVISTYSSSKERFSQLFPFISILSDLHFRQLSTNLIFGFRHFKCITQFNEASRKISIAHVIHL